jgi:hypothetical protein
MLPMHANFKKDGVHDIKAEVRGIIREAGQQSGMFSSFRATPERGEGASDQISNFAWPFPPSFPQLPGEY